MYCKKCSPGAGPACALTGSFYGITWIRTLNWNAWTVLFLSAGLALLLAGLQKNSQKWLAAAGFVLAINTYFRMPNMLFLALMAVVFWKTLLDEWKHVGAAEENALAMPDNVASAHRVINHVPDGTVSAEKTGEVKIRALFRPRIWWEALKSCRGFFLGAVAGAAVGLLLALIFLGPDTVLHNLSVLTSVGAGENAENTPQHHHRHLSVPAGHAGRGTSLAAAWLSVGSGVGSCGRGEASCGSACAGKRQKKRWKSLHWLYTLRLALPAFSVCPRACGRTSYRHIYGWLLG